MTDSTGPDQPDKAGNLETDLNKLRGLAAQRYDAFEVMRHLLQADDDIDDGELDQLIEAIAAPIIAAIDCTACANCCHNLDVYLIPRDVPRLASALQRPIKEVEHEFCLMTHEIQDEWARLRHKPCTFLNDRLCSLYRHRPQSCRDYPVFTPDFRWMLSDTIAGAGLCPIIYNVLDRVEAISDDISAGRITKPDDLPLTSQP